MRWLWRGLAVLGLALWAQTAQAQCPTCTPLALPSGGATGLDVQVARGGGWALAPAVQGAWLSYPSQQARGRPTLDPNQARIDVGITTLQLAAQHRSGFGLDLQLPVVAITARSVAEQRTDLGLGDLELRGRFAASPHRRVALLFASGWALPTGRYEPRSGALALSEAAQALTPGRATTWLTADAEVRVEALPIWTWSALVSGRVPLYDVSDGFRWAPELRGHIESRVEVIKKRLQLGALFEAQWRGVSSLIDPFLQARTAALGTGGVWLTLAPRVVVQLSDQLFAFADVRLPLWQRLEGFQFAQGVGVSIGVSAVFGVRQQEERRTEWRVRRYVADWCVACHALDAVFAELKLSRRDLVFEDIDVTEWSAEQLQAAIPGTGALPVVELITPQGKLGRRVEGAGPADVRTLITEIL